MKSSSSPEIARSFGPPRLVGLALAMIACLMALAVPRPAAAAIEIVEFDGGFADDSGAPVTQAGSHPNMTTHFLTGEGAGGGAAENFKDVTVDFPPGLVIDPTSVPQCPQALMLGKTGAPECSGSSQVGVLTLGNGQGAFNSVPIFNVVPGSEAPGRFAASISSVIVNFTASVRSNSDYGISSMSMRTSESLSYRDIKVEIWGVPADEVHDPKRSCFGNVTVGCQADETPRAMISLPTDCSAGPLTTSIRMNSWQDTASYAEASFDEDLNGDPIQMTGCENVHFEPRITVQPESRQADSPTGVEVKLSIPQSDDPEGYARAMLNRATVTLPEGMAVNPSSADGQVGCAPAQIAVKSAAPPSCPPSSKIADVRIQTPLLPEEMTGAVYLATQRSNPFNSTLAMYLVAEGPGIVLKVPGRISPDPVTGQITTVFDDNPQLPFETLTLRFKGGPRAPLVNPPTCGQKTSAGEFVPWSALDKDAPTADELRTDSDSFPITSGPGGGPCPSGQFGPAFEAGTTNPVAGDYSPFALRLARADGTQRIGALSVMLPQGLVGKLAGIPYCPDATLAAISPAEGTGAAQIASPSCPAASQVGTATVGAGAGADPVYVDSGRVYLAGPYKGAPLSLAVVAPAVTGPFDLGTVVVRNALRVDPVSAQITAVSDPIPTILSGIPLNVRDIRLSIDRPGFTLNPTSCEAMQVSGTATATTGATAALQNRFKVVGCGELGFKPRLSMRFYGAPPRRGGFPKLTATLTAPKGQANIGKASVLLPGTELLEQNHIRTICTRDQWASDTCPKAAIYGKAKAWTPLLDEPLEGPVYLRANGGARELPDLVADLRGQIKVELAGYIDTVKRNGVPRMRTRFLGVPDAPVTKFVLQMQGGRKGLLANNTNLCKAKPRAGVQFDGQNGKVHDTNPLVAVSGCGKKGK